MYTAVQLWIGGSKRVIPVSLGPMVWYCKKGSRKDVANLVSPTPCLDPLLLRGLFFNKLVNATKRSVRSQDWHLYPCLTKRFQFTKIHYNLCPPFLQKSETSSYLVSANHHLYQYPNNFT